MMIKVGVELELFYRYSTTLSNFVLQIVLRVQTLPMMAFPQRYRG